jgi:phosphinothricin acetyltransferase
VELSIYVDANQCHQHIGRFHQYGYKFSRWYDMVWIEKMLGDHPVSLAGPISKNASLADDS